MSDTGPVMPDDATAPVVEPLGWYGKVPALGDFVTRQLPRSFVDRWDEWLSAELAESQRALGEEWAHLYRHAPTWCFSLGAGVVDDRCWQGILVPSFDRVGREFPLTIARRWPGRIVLPMPGSWWTELVSIGQRALERRFNADALDAALASLAGLRGAFPASSGAVAEEAPESERTAVGVGTSSWWPRPTEATAVEAAMGTFSHSFSGLPVGRHFQQLLRSRT